MVQSFYVYLVWDLIDRPTAWGSRRIAGQSSSRVLYWSYGPPSADGTFFLFLIMKTYTTVLFHSKIPGIPW